MAEQSPFGDAPAQQDQQQSAQTQQQSPFGDAPVDAGDASARAGDVPGRQAVRGAAETALSLGTASIAEPIAGLHGVFEGVASFVAGEEEPMMQAADRVRQLREALTFKPQTEAGQQAMQTVGQVFEPLAQGAQAAGEQVQDITGSPMLAAATRSAAELAPGAIGFRPSTFRGGMQARQAGRAIEQETPIRLGGVNQPLEGRPSRQGQQIAETTEQVSGGRQVQGEGFEDIQRAVVEARNRTRNEVNAMFDEAREQGAQAGVRTREVKRFAELTQQTIRDAGFELEDNSVLRRRMNELDEIRELPDNSIKKLNDLFQFRKKLNRRKGRSDEEKAALGMMKGQLDEFLDAQFNSDMIRGDPQSIEKWKRANQAWQTYKEEFKDIKVIRQLAEQEADSTMIRQWIMGTSAVGGPKQAGQVVGRLKSILGEDSPEFTAIRQDVALDIMEPLMQPDPEDINLKRFRQNYDRFVRKRPDLAREILGENMEGMKRLRQAVEGVQKASTLDLNLDIVPNMARGFAGHGIAKGYMRQNIVQNAIRLAVGAATKSRRRQILGAISGYDPSTAVLQRTPLAVAAGTQAGIQAGEGQVESTQRAGGQQAPPEQPAGTAMTPPASAGRRTRQ